jgi:hypothetical protein
MRDYALSGIGAEPPRTHVTAGGSHGLIDRELGTSRRGKIL